MTIGIKSIETHVPSLRIDNVKNAKKFDKDKNFLINKVGPLSLPRKSKVLDTSDLATLAVNNLINKSEGLSKNDIQALVLITQNPDGEGLPHTSAIIQEKTSLPSEIASFDVSLGCSGYVYGLYLLKGFLETSGLSNGVLVTCDPYSKIIDPNDQNTSLLFGDAATATWLGEDPQWTLGSVKYFTNGSGAEFLQKKNGKLIMNGRQIFNFAARDVFSQISSILEHQKIRVDEVDLFCLHQGSKAIIDYIKKKLQIKDNQIIYDIEKSGNTVSSSIPLAFKKRINDTNLNKVIISGFGVGLSSATALITRRTN